MGESQAVAMYVLCSPPFVILLSIFLVLTDPAMGQFTDDDFTGNLLQGWQGDTGLFRLEQGRLQLFDSDGDKSPAILYRPVFPNAADTIRWDLWIRFDFAPSGSNFGEFVLWASDSTFGDHYEGYSLRVGGISGSDDALVLLRKDGDSETELIVGQAGAVGQAPVLTRVRVTRTPDAIWTLEADYQGGTAFQTEGMTSDATYTDGTYAGLLTRYTSTRSEAFFFDDFRLGRDQEAPELLQAEATGPASVVISFNEPLLSSSAETPAFYAIQPGNIVPTTASLQPNNPRQVDLGLAQALTDGTQYTLTAHGPLDLGNLPATNQTATFNYIEIAVPQVGDLRITEIMADPSPPQQLPEIEYLELRHTGTKAINLQGLMLSAGGNPGTLAEEVVMPGEYVILCESSEAEAFLPFGRVVPVDGFPTLNNGGDEIVLSNSQGQVLMSQLYERQWYRDPDKADGGFSLELIDLTRDPACPGNWKATNDDGGGSPGSKNTVDGQEVEKVPPQLMGIDIQAPDELLLFFSEDLKMGASPLGDLIRIVDGPQVQDAILWSPDTVLVFLVSRPDSGRIYELMLQPGLTDCLGNAAPAVQTATFALTHPAKAGDLVVNEILFAPQTGGEDYVECYNRSERVLQLQGLSIRNNTRTSGQETTILPSFLLPPGTLVVFTPDRADILSRYQVADPNALLENDLPAFNVDSGNVSIVNELGVVIDSFDYSEDQHFPLLTTTRGVSLERISPEAPSQDRGNWHSAAEAVGFGTPTGDNSQFVPLDPSPIPDIFRLPNKRFSPDGDGFEDVLIIEYEVDQPGYLLNLRVLDAVGREVRYLVNNQLLATRGQISWDGVDAEGRKARTGIYVLWIELFNLEGEVHRQKESIVLAGQLR